MKNIFTAILATALMFSGVATAETDNATPRSIMVERLYKVAPQPNQEDVLKKVSNLSKEVGSNYSSSRETTSVPVILGTELIQNGGFESGPSAYMLGFAAIGSPWSWHAEGSSATDYPRYNGANHSGSWGIYFDLGVSQNQLNQKITIPSGNTVTLSFWLNYRPGAVGGSNPLDVLGVNFCKLDGSAIDTFVKNYRPANSPGASWVYYSYDVSALAGQTVYLLFWTDNIGHTVFLLDDVSLVTNATAPPVASTKSILSSGIARAAGNAGAFWLSDMTFANGSIDNLTIKFFKGNSTTPETFGFVLPAGNSRTIIDIVQNMGLADGSYVLRTEASCPVSNPSCSLEGFNVTARTYSQGFGGWFGTALPSMTSFTGTKTFAFQEIDNSRKALFVFGIPSSTPTTYDKTGKVISYIDVGLFSTGNLTRVPLGETVSYVRISVPSSSFAYGTQVDNATQSQIIVY